MQGSEFKVQMPPQAIAKKSLARVSPATDLFSQWGSIHGQQWEDTRVPAVGISEGNCTHLNTQG